MLTLDFATESGQDQVLQVEGFRYRQGVPRRPGTRSWSCRRSSGRGGAGLGAVHAGGGERARARARCARSGRGPPLVNPQHYAHSSCPQLYRNLSHSRILPVPSATHDRAFVHPPDRSSGVRRRRAHHSRLPLLPRHPHERAWFRKSHISRRGPDPFSDPPNADPRSSHDPLLLRLPRRRLPLRPSSPPRSTLSLLSSSSRLPASASSTSSVRRPFGSGRGARDARPVCDRGGPEAC